MTHADPAARPLDALDAGWRRARSSRSLAEVHATVPVPHGAGFWRKALAFLGPGLLVSVGYMDPGNWATDLDGGAKFGYTLLSVILISNVMAIILQHLALKLGVATGRDLAQACRDHYPRPVNIALWVLCELAIAACDLAEVIGSAVALNLLFKIPLVWGILITGLDAMLVLALMHRGFRWLECVIAVLVFTIGACFAYELIVSRPDFPAALRGLFPVPEIVTDQRKLYVAIAILGATVMPHNLYLHSSIVQTRKYEQTEDGRAMAIRFATIDSTLALLMAFFINASILVLAAAAFHGTEHQNAELGIRDAHRLLTPVLGASLASTLFAVALLASGQSSTLTGTLAGQIVMEGFMNLRLRPWVRRLTTRSLAIIPAVIVAAVYKEHGVDRLLLLSQVILSMQLSFAVIPLVYFTGQKSKMGRFANGKLLAATAWAIAAIIAGLNVYYLVQQVASALGWGASEP